MKILSIFNNKGGVGKTTYMFHLAHLLSRKGKKILIVDCDSQCNLTSYTLTDNDVSKAWNEKGNSIWKIIEPIYEGIGDFRKRAPIKLTDNLMLVPGDLNLSNFEDRLGDTWNSAKGGSTPDIRNQTAIFRYLQWVVDENNIDLVLVDLGPNLGALNRSVLGASNYFIIPISADLFSIKGTENLGNKLQIWAKEWYQINTAWNDNGTFKLPKGTPKFLGFVTQQHNIRANKEGMTIGWQIFATKIDDAVKNNIVAKLKDNNQVDIKDNYNLGKIPNLHSLIPYSQDAKKPVFDCTSKDGLKGAHITRAKESSKYFEGMVDVIMNIINCN